jgi:hypothetical protein
MVKINPLMLMGPIEAPSSLVDGLDQQDYDAWNEGEEVSAEIAAKCDAFCAWCRTEQARRFDLLLEYRGLAHDDSVTGREWRKFALSLASATYPSLRWPEPRPKGKVGRPRDAVPKVLIRVAKEYWKALPEIIKQDTAIVGAGVNRGYFFEAKARAGLKDDDLWWRQFPPEIESGK